MFVLRGGSVSQKLRPAAYAHEAGPSSPVDYRPISSSIGCPDHQPHPAQPHPRGPIRGFQRLLEQYNAGSLNVQQYFDELVKLSHSLTEEEALVVSAGLTEEQLAIFDLLTRPGPGRTADEEQQVKRVAEEVLAVLKREKLVLDWRKEQRTRILSSTVTCQNGSCSTLLPEPGVSNSTRRSSTIFACSIRFSSSPSSLTKSTLVTVTCPVSVGDGGSYSASRCASQHGSEEEVEFGGGPVDRREARDGECDLPRLRAVAVKLREFQWK